MDGVEDFGDYFWSVIEAAKRGDYDGPVMTNFLRDHTQCPMCGGRGEKNGRPCCLCSGYGWVRKVTE